MKFIIKALTDKNSQNKFKAYKALQERKRLLEGFGVGSKLQKKVNLLKRMLDKAHNKKYQAMRKFREFLKNTKSLDMRKSKICLWFKSKANRDMASVFRQLRLFNKQACDFHLAKIQKKKRICSRIYNSSVRLLGMGMNN